MDVIDYRNSYVFNTSAYDDTEDNTCRTQIVARCELSNRKTGKAEDYFLGKACIGEHVYLPEIAQIPTSEVCVIFHSTHFKLLKRFADHGEIQIARIDEKARNFDGRYRYFKDQHFDLRLASASLLANPDEIIEATLKSKPLVGRTELHSAESQWSACLEYPIDYMNIHPPIKGFQVDVGPILFPDFAAAQDPTVSMFELAYILYNRLDKAEFAVREPTYPAAVNGVQVMHYAKVQYVNVRNELFSLDK